MNRRQTPTNTILHFSISRLLRSGLLRRGRPEERSHCHGLQQLAVALEDVDEGDAQLAGPVPHDLRLDGDGLEAVLELDRELDRRARRDRLGDADGEAA